MRILVIKTSSLGDVLQTLPAVSDARRAKPDLTIDWLVEEAFAPAPAWHPGVADVIPIALRRWRKQIHARQILALIRRLREQRYDLVIDAQGLLRSAALTSIARGPGKGTLLRPCCSCCECPRAATVADGLRRVMERREV